MIAFFVMINAAWTYWVLSQEVVIRDLLQTLATQLEIRPYNAVALFREDLDSQLTDYGQIAYITYQSLVNEDRHGYINLRSFSQGAGKLGDVFFLQGEKRSLEAIFQNENYFASPYLKELSQKIYDGRIPVGLLKAGFIFPGYHSSLSWLGRGFVSILLLLNMLWATLLLFFLRKSRPLLERCKRLEEAGDKLMDQEIEVKISKDLAWLSHPNAMDAQDDEDTKINQPIKGKWNELFSENDLRHMNSQGQWYVHKHHVIGFPWGSCLTMKEKLHSQSYDFEVEVQKISGMEGFLLLFPCNGHQLYWVLGGWKNKRSEVAGYPQTVSKSKIERGRRYYCKIEVDAHEARGFLDGVHVWTLQREEIDRPSPDAGLAKGLGVGVWNSLTRFDRIRIVENI